MTNYRIREDGFTFIVEPLAPDDEHLPGWTLAPAVRPGGWELTIEGPDGAKVTVDGDAAELVAHAISYARKAFTGGLGID